MSRSASLVLLLTLVSTSAFAQSPCTRWAGGVLIDDDYTAAVVRVDAHSGTAAFPNQRRGVRFTTVSREGDELRLEAPPAQRWRGRIQGRTFEGSWSDGDQTGRFELVCAPDIPALRLRDFDGVYRFDDGAVVRIKFLSRMTDELLAYFDPAARDERWLFPMSATEFVAGPTFERPSPVERRFEFLIDASGSVTGFRVARERGSRVAHRQPQFVPVASIEREVQEFLRAQDVPGVSVGVVTRDGLRWARGFGFADRERRIETSSETSYQIGSVTKVFTSTLLMALAERGVLRLDDPIDKWLPPDAVPDRTITLRDLATHVSGLPGNPINRVDRDGVMQPYHVDDLLAGMRGTILQSRPGASWSYSNLGFALLGHLLERASGQTYATLLRERITAPLSMTATAVTPSPETEARLAVHYWPEDQPRKPRPRWQFGSVAGFGGITSTVPDLAMFLALHLRAGEEHQQPISGSALATMQRPQVMLGGWQRAMAIGWMIRRDRDSTTIVHHGGEVDGHSAFVAFSPADRIGIIVLANLGGSTAEDLGQRLLEIVIEEKRRNDVATRGEAFEAFFRGEWGRASAALQKIATSAPNDGVVWSRLGVALARAGKVDEARAALTKAAALDYQPQEAAKELALLPR